MKSWKFAVVAALSCFGALCSPTLLRADSAAQAKKAVAAQYAKMDAALSKKDFAALRKYCTKDFVNIDEKGKKTNLEEQIKSMEPLVSAAQTFKFVTAVQSCKESGNTVTVHAKQHISASVKNPQDGKIMQLVGDSVVDDVWTKSGATYLLKTSKTISEKATIDGNPI